MALSVYSWERMFSRFLEKSSAGAGLDDRILLPAFLASEPEKIGRTSNCTVRTRLSSLSSASTS